MFRFNGLKVTLYGTQKEFKYITCFGSTVHFCFWKNHRIPFKYITCFGSTKVKTVDGAAGEVFKYITCFGSTWSKLQVLEKN